jgi:hypothetical protein
MVRGGTESQHYEFHRRGVSSMPTCIVTLDRDPKCKFLNITAYSEMNSYVPLLETVLLPISDRNYHYILA